jgi:hypothetical protein
MNILPDFVSPVNEQFQPGAAVTLRRPAPRSFSQAGRVVAAWDTGISHAGTVARITSAAGQVFIRVTPDPDAGFGEFAFFPGELRIVQVAQ